MWKFLKFFLAVVTTPFSVASIFCLQIGIFALQAAQLASSQVINFGFFGKNAKLVNDAGWQFAIDGLTSFRNSFFNLYTEPFKEGWQSVRHSLSDSGFGAIDKEIVKDSGTWFEKDAQNNKTKLNDKETLKKSSEKIYKNVKNSLVSDDSLNSKKKTIDPKNKVNLDDINLEIDPTKKTPSNITFSRDPGKGVCGEAIFSDAKTTSTSKS